MLRRRTSWTLAVSGWLVMASVVADSQADEPPIAAPEPASAPSAESIRQWIVDLDADKFDVREKASQSLTSTGAAVIDPLVKAAEGGSLEVAMRAVTILGKLNESQDEATQSEAELALTRLSETKNAAVAARASAALQAAEAAQQANQPPGIRIGGGGLQIGGGGGIQIIAGNGGGAVVQMNGQGARTAIVHENGKTIQVQEDKNGVEVSITAQENGQLKTTTYKAKDVVELKKNHPGAYKLYRQHLPAQQAGGGLVIRGNVVIRGAGAPPPPAADNAKAADQLTEARKRVAATMDQLRKDAAAGKISPEKLEQALQQIDRELKTLDEIAAELKP